MGPSTRPLAADPTAGAAAVRVLTGPRWRLGAADIAALIARHPGKRFLELGRSCVLPPYGLGATELDTIKDYTRRLARKGRGRFTEHLLD